VQKDRACLHAVFAFAEELELRDGNPVSRVAPPKAEKRTPVILDADQYEKLLAACEGRPMVTLYVTTLAEAGLRCDSEALFLRWEDVDLDGGFLWIATGRDGHRTKSGKGRWVPMTPRLHQAMREHFARFRFATYQGQRTPWVFHHDLRRRPAKAGDRLHTLHFLQQFLVFQPPPHELVFKVLDGLLQTRILRKNRQQHVSILTSQYRIAVQPLLQVEEKHGGEHVRPLAPALGGLLFSPAPALPPCQA
jgi:integrase